MKLTTAGPGRPGVPRCHAPWTSLYLDPRGEVKACCQNEWLRLGNVAELSLGEIWRGDEVARLRERVATGDLTLGCEMCAMALDRGAGEVAYLHAFDGLRLDGADGWPQQLELALSNTCNLQCVMCNGELSSAIRVRREGRRPLVSPYGERFFAELDEFLPHLRAITFLGGEPLLARESRRVLDRLVELGLGPTCSITTNGTHWDDRVERLVAHLPMDVAVSIDGTSAAVVEAVRVGVDHRALIANIGRIHRSLLAAGGRMRLSYCLMVPTWPELGELLAWADELDVDVFVNTVHHPPQLSFAHCELDELARVVDALGAEDARRRAALGRNRQVWIDQLEGLVTLLDQRRGAPAGAGVAVALGPRTTALVADGRQLISRVHPGEAPTHGVDVERLVGEPLWSVVRLLGETLGPLESSTVRRLDDGTERRHLVFGGPRGPIAVEAEMHVRSDGGPTWILRFGERDGVAPG